MLRSALPHSAFAALFLILSLVQSLSHNLGLTPLLVHMPDWCACVLLLQVRSQEFLGSTSFIMMENLVVAMMTTSGLKWQVQLVLI